MKIRNCYTFDFSSITREYILVKCSSIYKDMSFREYLRTEDVSAKNFKERVFRHEESGKIIVIPWQDARTTTIADAENEVDRILARDAWDERHEKRSGFGVSFESLGSMIGSK